MGLDARDCRLDIAFILGDANVPDDVSWAEELRDKSCVWLDFIDSQFDPCVRRRYDSCADSTDVSSIMTNPEDNTILTLDESSVIILPDLVHTTIDLNAVPSGMNNLVSNTPLHNAIVTAIPKEDVVCTVNDRNSVVVRNKSNTVSVKNQNNVL